MEPPGPVIEDGRPRELFASWVDEALAATRPPPSALAAAYLVDLLAEQVRAAGPSAEAAPTLAEAWLKARAAEGSERLQGLRAVGDRALFVAGFFGASLTRRMVGIDYYRDIGQAAYGDLQSALSANGFGALYGELAARFGDCLGVLAAIGRRARPDGVEGLLHLYDRWLSTGQEEDRRALLARGCFLGPLRDRSVQ